MFSAPFASLSASSPHEGHVFPDSTAVCLSRRHTPNTSLSYPVDRPRRSVFSLGRTYIRASEGTRPTTPTVGFESLMGVPSDSLRRGLRPPRGYIPERSRQRACAGSRGAFVSGQHDAGRPRAVACGSSPNHVASAKIPITRVRPRDWGLRRRYHRCRERQCSCTHRLKWIYMN